MTHILIPRTPTQALLRPFIECPTPELDQAWAAMVRIAEVQHARDGRSCLAQIEEPAGAAPAAVAPQGEYPPLPEGVMFIEQIGGDVIARPTEYAYFKNARGVVHGAQLFTADQLRAYFDLGRQAAPALEAPAAKPGDMVAVPRDLIGAACGAISKKRDAPTLLAELRRYTTGDLSRALEAPAAPAVPLKATPEMRAAFRRAYRGGAYREREIWGNRVDYALDQMLAAAPQAPAAPSAVATQVVESLLQLARIVNTAVEDWGESFEDGSSEVTFHKEEADKLEEILEFFDSLPDAPPEEGVILSGPSRAARVLRAMAAPAAPAVDASDTDLLDAMQRHRIALVPEHEGPWDAELYEEGEEPQHIGSGATPREALRAALAAQTKEGGA